MDEGSKISASSVFLRRNYAAYKYTLESEQINNVLITFCNIIIKNRKDIRFDNKQRESNNSRKAANNHINWGRFIIHDENIIK